MLLVCSNSFTDDPPLSRNEIQIPYNGIRSQSQNLKICLIWIRLNLLYLPGMCHHVLYPHVSNELNFLHASLALTNQILQLSGFNSSITNTSWEAFPKLTLPFFFNRTSAPSILLSYSSYPTIAQLLMSSLLYCSMSSSTTLFNIHSSPQSTLAIAWHIGSDQ